MHRRTFLNAALQTAGATMAPQAARSAPGHVGEGIKLGFDTYSVRAFKWKDIQLLDFAASLKCDTVQISDSADYSSLDEAHLKTVKDHAARLGIEIDSGIGTICPLSKGWKPGRTPEQVIGDGLRIAKTVGARSMRCTASGIDDRRSDRPIEQIMDAAIKVFRSVKQQAQDSGVRIALENHGDLTAREARTIIEESGKEFVGSCLDTGNPSSLMEDPMLTLEVLGPYAVTTHVRDWVAFEHPRGAAVQWVAMGDGMIDWPQFFALYQKLCPKSLLQLEIITGRPPAVLPYFEQDWWKYFPHMPANDFARFTAIVRRGHPYMGTMIIEDAPGAKPAEYTEALREQQRFDLARSIGYAQKEIGLGLRWKA